MDQSKEKRFKTEIKQNNYLEALKKAKEKLPTLNPDQVALRSGAEFITADSQFKLTMANEDYYISYPAGEVEYAAKDKEVQLPVKVLILHYLNQASGVPLADKLISFREVPEGGEIYYGPFKKRTIDPLVKYFGEQPEKLITVAQYLGGYEEDLGDYSVTVPVFPKIPVTYVLWEGDEEFPPSGNVLFDSSAISYLPSEDLVFVASIPIWAFKGILKSL